MAPAWKAPLTAILVMLITLSAHALVLQADTLPPCAQLRPDQMCGTGYGSLESSHGSSLSEAIDHCVADAGCAAVQSSYYYGLFYDCPHDDQADAGYNHHIEPNSPGMKVFDLTSCASGGGGGSATGDPHLQNIHGERFDLMKDGSHMLINIPRGESADAALLRVEAEARLLGGNCADMYFQRVNITGAWAVAKQPGGYAFASEITDNEPPNWMLFGKVELKVVHGHTHTGTKYLNIYVRHLGRAGFPIGGLLGEDDHSEVTTLPEACKHKVQLRNSHGDLQKRNDMADDHGPASSSSASASL